MTNNFEQNILKINELIHNNQSIFSDFTFIFNKYTIFIIVIVSLLIIVLANLNKKDITKYKFIHRITSPLIMTILIICFTISSIGLLSIHNKKEENIDIFYEYLQADNLEHLTNKYSLQEIKLMKLYIPSYHIEYEKDGYFEKYKTDEFDFLSNSVDLHNINKNISKNKNRNQTLITISEKDEVLFLDNQILKEELVKIEKKHNIDLSLIKNNLIKETNGKLYKLNLTEETFDKMIEQGVDNL